MLSPRPQIAFPFLISFPHVFAEGDHTSSSPWGTFYDLEDMTATYHSIGMFMDEPDEDMDYVPYLFDVLDEGFTMKFKYELNTAMEYIVTTARRKKNAV